MNTKHTILACLTIAALSLGATGCVAGSDSDSLSDEEGAAEGAAESAAAVIAFPKWRPGHYVFIGINTGPLQAKQIKEGFRGVQKAYLWNEIEVARDVYDFSEIDGDIQLLAAHGKSLVIQIQYKTFGPGTTAVPKYILNGAAEFGPNRTYLNRKDAIYPSIWNKKIGDRFRALISALGKRYDANATVTAVNLPETAQSNKGTIEYLKGLGYTPESYTDAIKQNMLSLKQSFPHTVTFQYINWGPANAIPTWTAYAKQIGVGVGGPDVHPDRDSIPGWAATKELAGTVPVAGAVQFEDYFKKPTVENSGIIDPWATYKYARDDLHLNYIFWGNAPSEGFQKASDMVSSPQFPDDPAGGLPKALPTKLKTP